MNFVYILISGTQLGSIYALVALGYSMVYGIIKLVNFAHGDIIMVGAYFVWYAMSRYGVPPLAAAVASVFFCAALGVLIEKIAYRPLRRSSRLSMLVTAIGVSLFLQNAVMLMFKPDPRMFKNFFTGAVTIGDRQFSSDTLVTIAVSLVIMVILTLIVKRTKIGKAMRAVSEDNEAAQLMGINVDTTISFTFAIGSGLAAVGSLFYCVSYSQIQPTMGGMLGLKAFVAAVLGGIGSIPGAMIGGLCIGIAESMTKGFISSRLTDAVVFGILIVVLLFRPTGIMGRAMGDKV
jgi:branched-chain amino acid transport system permease protein